MLDTIRRDLNMEVESTFGQFYQHYIVSLQDDIINRDTVRASRNFTSIEDTVELIKVLNILEEEL